jgi:hypothetical protein
MTTLRPGLIYAVVPMLALAAANAAAAAPPEASGRSQMTQGRIDYADGRMARIEAIAHKLEYRLGTRKIVRASCTIVDSEGRTLEMSFEPTHTPIITSALGYALEKRGFSDDRGMGVYRGESWIESDVWHHDGNDAVDPSGARYPYNGYIGPAAVTDGQERGMAYFETVIIGSYARYGFTANGLVPVTVLPIS